MKLLELEITNTRGIRHFVFKPEGKNLVVWGPNGSGKSGVVDSLDFLLTGKISRLTGQGTGSISLVKHGPHVDCRPEEAIVRAVVQLPGLKGPVEIKRCMAQPSELLCDDGVKGTIKPIITLASRGQHVLTRREVLRYITSDGGTRATEIQELLNITEIEEIRKSLVKAKNDLAKELVVAKRNLKTNTDAISGTIKKKALSEAVVLEEINNTRALLGGSPITKPHSTQLKSGVKLPTTSINQRATVNASLLEADIKSLQSVISDRMQAQVLPCDQKLRSAINAVRSDPLLLSEYSTKNLTQLGLELLDDTGRCPLCDMAWEQNKLRRHLEHKLVAAKAVEGYERQIQEASPLIANRISSILANLKKIIAATQIVNLAEDLKSLTKWQSSLQLLLDAIESPIEKYLITGFEPDRIKRLLAPNDLAEITLRILTAVKIRFPEATPEQNAWDMLTRLEENLKAYENAKAEYRSSDISSQRATILLECFELSRNSILSKMYDSIKDRFVGLYKGLHGLDEDGFNALLEPDGAALNLEVGFYGRGTHPPHALHSEGHQDSMGLCLYLALAERLTESLIELTVLDDVVMSVDSDHRRELCRLLAKEFPNRQFLITTHDRTWMTQLRTEGVVNSKGTVEFYNWNVETGPQFHSELNIWERIEKDIQGNDINAAAAKLRRGSEEFFSLACDSLEAFVKYKLSGRWELGDYLPSAFGQFRALLKKAKCAAQSWGDKETVSVLGEIESTACQIYARSTAEQWAVNGSVHYNNWVNLSSKDFRPVVEAFQDLHNLFICSNNSCSSMIRVAKSDFSPVTVSCRCGKVNWNLQEKV
jgi:energy-coupling factor transporter ATP-binding protein EcfA2